MKNRTAGVLIGVLAVVCFGLLFSAVYPFATSDPHAANPPGERFTVGEADAYSATGSIVVDEEVRLAFEGVVTPDGAWYQEVVEDGVTSEEYRPAGSGTVYQRFTIEDRDHAERLREEISTDEDRKLVREDSDGDGTTFIVEKDATGAGEPVSGTASVFVNSLFVAGYEADEPGSSGVTVYEPRSGWYDGTEPYRITRVSGDVRVDADTHAVRSANVSWDVTAPAGTYAEYVLVRVTGDDPTTHGITFEFDPGDHDLDRPTWAGEPDPEQEGH